MFISLAYKLKQRITKNGVLELNCHMCDQHTRFSKNQLISYLLSKTCKNLLCTKNHRTILSYIITKNAYMKIHKHCFYMLQT